MKNIDTHYAILSSAAEMLEHYSLIKGAGYVTSEKEYKALLVNRISDAYRQIVTFRHGNHTAIAGYWIKTELFGEKYIELDFLILKKKQDTDQDFDFLCSKLEEEANKQGYSTVVINSELANNLVHKFCFQRGYVIDKLHFRKSLV